MTEDFIYDLAHHRIMGIESVYGAWTNAQVYAGGQHIASYTGGPSGATNFLFTDNLGSTRVVAAYPSPGVAECDDYYPFGELISCGGTSTTPFKFTGY